MGDAQDEHDERFRLDLVKNAVVADAKAAQSLQVALQGRAPIGIVGQPVYGRSDPRIRSGLPKRCNSLAALRLIRIEKFTPDLVPVQHRIVGVAETVDGCGQIVEILNVAFDRLADNVCPAAPQLRRGAVQRTDQ